MDVHLRRRIAFASVLTLIAVPAYLVLGRDTADSSIDPTAIATAAGEADTGSTDTGALDTMTVPATDMPTPVFLDNTVVIVPPAVIDVARPEPIEGRQADGKASFREYNEPAGMRPCTTSLTQEGAEVTVTNTANGLSVVCTNVFGLDLPPGVTVVLDTDLYSTMANLSDAPIFVRVTW